MARINLLPWREAQRKERQKQFITLAGLMAGLTVVIVFYVHLHIGELIDGQNARNNFLQEQIAILDKKIEAIKELESEKERLLARMNIIQELQRSRPVIVQQFDELVRLLPEGIYLTSIERKGNVITIQGMAQSNARVSSLMRNLDASIRFTNPRLVIIDSSKVKDSTGSAFTLTVQQGIVENKDKEAGAGA